MCFPFRNKKFVKSHKNAPKRFLSLESSITILFWLIIASCAQIRTPTGGERDKEPPVLVKSLPENKTLNFSDKKILLEFDEFIQLKNRNRITITPEIEGGIEVKERLKNIEVLLNGSLQENTTYVINFSNSIADLNEGNELKNFTYVFSTGNSIDSLSLKGKITNSKDGKAAANVLVLLYRGQEDLKDVLIKTTPYSVQTTSDGEYIFNNLSEGYYRLVALEDLNQNRRWDKEEAIGFTNDVFILNESINMDLNLVETEKQFKILNRRLTENGKIVLITNLPIDSSYSVLINPNREFVYASFETQIAVWLTNFNNSGNITLSINKDDHRDSSRVFIPENIRPEELKIGSNLVNNTLKPSTKIKITLNNPVLKHPEKLILIEDGVEINVSTKTKLTFTGSEIELDYLPKANKTYKLVIKKGELIDIYNQRNEEISIEFKVNSITNYGNLALDFKPENAGNYIIELRSERNEIIAREYISGNSKKNYNLLNPGKYSIKIYYDLNKNGSWDPARPLENIQAETIYNHPKEIVIRANWDVEEQVIIP